MGIEIDAYRSRIAESISPAKDIERISDQISEFLEDAESAIDLFKRLDETTDEVDRSVTTTDRVLQVLEFVSPLKTPVNLLRRTLEKVDESNDAADDKVDEVNGQRDNSTSDDDDEPLVEKVEQLVDDVGIVNDAVSDSAILRSRQLEIALEATGNFDSALNSATRTGVAWAGAFTALNTAVESQLGDRNDASADLQALYASVETRINGFLDVFDDIDFGGVKSSLVDLDAIVEIFESISSPLSIGGDLIEPIQPLLDALSAAIALIVDPIVKYVTETLNLDEIIDDVTGILENLLPPLTLLDQFNALLQDFKDLLLEYTIDALGHVTFLDAVEATLFGGVVGEADQGPTGWGNDVSNTLEGDEGDDILDALGGNDEIAGGAGNDVIIAGKGSDTLDGQSGEDLFYFDASFTEYELARDPDTGDIIVNHLAPRDGAGTGIDVLVSLEDSDHVVFTDISFTGAELNDAVIGGSVLNGDEGGVARDDLMFLNSLGILVGGFNVANGFLGDDRIFGSTQDDQLNGGPGNDVLLPGLGNDEANGGAGTDTFQVLEGARAQLTIDLFGGTAFGQGQDTLSSIENVIASPASKHKIEGNDTANTIYTGGGIDVVTGRGGDDFIDTGVEDDYIVGGAGQDTIDSGSGRDVMISGSAAEAGVSDLYIGGAGFDVVAYTSSSNTIRFDINDQSDDPSILQTLKTYMEDIEDSGPVRIDGTDGTVTRFDMDGEEVSVDTTVGVEGFVGSDMDDELFGGAVAELLHGGGGNDVIRTGGTENIDGGQGDDVIYAEAPTGGSTELQIEGGAGFDRLLLEEIGDARWFYRVESAISLTLRALDVSVEGDDLRNEGNAFFSIKPRGVEEISLGNFADHAIYAPGGSSTAVFYLLGGDDRFDGENGFADVYAAGGNDVGNFNRGGGGIFRGGAGDDYAVFSDTGRDNRALMGADTDLLEINRFRGHADGGAGFDTIVFDIAFDSRIVADLEAGTVASFKGVITNNAEQVEMTLENFEVVIATEFADLIDGSSGADQIVGLGGNDTLRGAGEADKLYGGDGNDTLEGGAGDDLLHGAAGSDLLDGGAGRDTASYAWARPDGREGAVIASGFGAVSVDLAAGTANGTFGADTLVSIENAIGTGESDVLAGDEGDNLLSGGAGDDRLEGRSGDDVLVTGTGDDTVGGGGGDDEIVVSAGVKTLNAGAGRDTLDFGTLTGTMSVDLAAGSYSGMVIKQTPRWALLAAGEDGSGPADGTETRVFDGVALTPDDVLEADPSYANSGDDAARSLPGEGDPDFARLQITLLPVEVSATGEIAGFEDVTGGASDDEIFGDGAGNRLSGAAGRDHLFGRAGADTLRGGLGDDTLNGGGGEDVAVFDLDLSDVTTSESDGVITIMSEEGTDRVENVELFRFNDQIVDGATLLESTAAPPAGADEPIIGTDGNDDLNGGSGNDIIAAGAGDDTITGAAGDDTIAGSDGNDIVNGGAGADNMGGGLGNDTMDGGNGDDTIGGGRGDDSMTGGPGNDIVNGGPGNDITTGGDGNDTMGASFGDDVVSGGDGNDSLGGGTGRDRLTGGAGSDDIGGGEGDDTVIGGAGNDFLAGGGRDDSITGGAGNDTINGGDGDDTMSGGTGTDVFVFNEFKRGEVDRVLDFEDGLDTLRMTGVENAPGTGLAGRLAALDIAATDIGGEEGVTVAYSGQVIELVGLRAGDLGLEDFTFV